MRNEWASPWRRRPVTMAMIIFSVLVFLGVGIPKEQATLSTCRSRLDNQLTEIENGEVWRLVTPIFLHFGILHIAFNMFWLYDLGTLIERRIGSFVFVLLVLALAIPSNYAAVPGHGAFFGGMSGVVYGLFGYAWVRGRLDPTCGLYLRPDIAFWMIGLVRAVLDAGRAECSQLGPRRRPGRRRRGRLPGLHVRTTSQEIAAPHAASP